MRVWRSVLVVAACVGMAGVAQAEQKTGAEPPIRAPGLWHVSGSIQVEHDGHKVKVPIGSSAEELVRCVDVASELKALQAEENRKTCPVQFGRDGKDFTLKIDCTLPDGTKALTMALMVVDRYAPGEEGKQMDFYHVESVIQSSAFSGHVSKTWTRIGACPAGIQGGDVGVIKDGKFRKLMGGKAAALMDRSLLGN